MWSSLVSIEESYDDIPGLTTVGELEFMQDCAARVVDEAGWFVELGTFKGRATAALCQEVGDSRVVTIDSYVMQHHGDNSLRRSTENLERIGFRPRLLEQPSHLVPEFVDQVVFLLIDTDHREQPLRRELEAWLPKMASKGVVCLHDYGCQKWPDVTKVADAVFRPWDWQLLGVLRKMVGYQRRK